MLHAREYAGVVSLCGEALESDPDNLDLRIIRARALMALRRDDEAKRELGRVLRWHSPSAEAYRLLGELAIRSGKLEAAETFLRHAVRLAPAEPSLAALLDLVQSSNQPTVAVEKLPAATATVGCTLCGTRHGANECAADEDAPPTLEASGSFDGNATFDTLDLSGFASSVDHRDDPTEQMLHQVPPGQAAVGVARRHGSEPGEDWPQGSEPAQEWPLGLRLDGDRPVAGRVADRFGGYLVGIGALTPIQLRAALDYHRRIGVRVGAAAVALGFLTEPSVEWAAHDYHVHRNDP
jgi:hypothetical protein